MKNFQGIWLPDHEVHLVEHMKKTGERADGKPAYQLKKIKAALSFVKNRHLAIDIGGHCGLWSMHLANHFEFVEAFEPIAAHRECFLKNIPDAVEPPKFGKVKINACALGDHAGTVSMHTSDGSSGDSWVKGEGDIPLATLDSFDFQYVDFIKLDCEGYELFALRGGEETIKRCRPTIIVEQKPGRAEKFGLAQKEAVTYLQWLGMELRQEISGDFILTFPDLPKVLQPEDIIVTIGEQIICSGTSAPENIVFASFDKVEGQGGQFDGGGASGNFEAPAETKAQESETVAVESEMTAAEGATVSTSGETE